MQVATSKSTGRKPKLTLQDKLDRVFEVKEKKFNRQHEMLSVDENERIADLVAKFHQVKEISLPYPSLYGKVVLDHYFGDLNNIDLGKPLHVAGVVFILENQDDETHVVKSKEQLKALIIKRSQKIGLHELQHYQQCVHEIFTAIKKNSINWQIEYLDNLAEWVQTLPETVG